MKPTIRPLDWSATTGRKFALDSQNAAAATTHVHRDGTTLMSYAGPRRGVVAGRVRGADRASLAATQEIEIMNGPLNLLIVEQ